MPPYLVALLMIALAFLAGLLFRDHTRTLRKELRRTEADGIHLDFRLESLSRESHQWTKKDLD
ncbi:hypothetical protein P12x_000253 [Tundrisphaera lichenicola]|uniref:hypothetical protein n=1 Tax=Tundrisphaera lichenicola TaxID=2029860 RepID=UPI003EBF613F